MSIHEDYPSLKLIVELLLKQWPEHADFVHKSFSDRDPRVAQVSEEIARCVLKITSDDNEALSRLCGDYRFLCEKIVLPEEIHFRRNNKYRLSSFADAMRECYANAPFMARYMNGLLLSNILWRNHSYAITAYADDYLASLAAGTELLEIGPGHGLLLYFAASNAKVASVSGWDVSPTSIEHTRSALHRLSVSRPVNLQLQNLFDVDAAASTQRFDAIVMSELLEHQEDPVQALRSAAAWLRPGGTVWVNVPANSPAPDHIYLFESPEHAGEIVNAAGFDVTTCEGYPMTGATLEKARKRKLAISCVVVGTKT